MPHCYLLSVCSGASLDQQSNNVTLFNLVEQINVPPNAPPPPRGVIPLEIHAYFRLDPQEIGERFEIRFVLVASTGLETFTEPSSHRSVTPRYRTRSLGLPMPPVLGQYELQVDWRLEGIERWEREPLAWPLSIVQASAAPQITH